MRAGKRITDPIKDLAESGKLAGLLLILATVISLALSNSGRAASYLGIWHIEVGFDFLHESVLHWINDGLMAVFFFLIGLEIKQELQDGELAVKERPFFLYWQQLAACCSLPLSFSFLIPDQRNI